MHVTCQEIFNVASIVRVMMTENEDLINSFCYDFDSKYLYFELADKQNPSSWIIDVIADDGDVKLGEIRYYAHWRQYAFFTNGFIILEKTCMTDITRFLGEINSFQKRGIKPPKMEQKKIVV